MSNIFDMTLPTEAKDNTLSSAILALDGNSIELNFSRTIEPNDTTPVAGDFTVYPDTTNGVTVTGVVFGSSTSQLIVSISPAVTQLEETLLSYASCSHNISLFTGIAVTKQ